MSNLHTLLIYTAISAATTVGLSLGAGPAGSAQANAHDEASVRALYEQLMDGWNRGDGVAFGAAFDEHADLVGPGGFHLRGRARIVAFHQMLFDGILKGTCLVSTVRGVRFLTEDVAVLHAIGGPSQACDSSAVARRQSIHTLVAVRRNGAWLVDAFQNTPI